MKKQFRTANWNSVGYVSTVILTMLIAGLFYYATFNVYRNDGFSALFFFLLCSASVVPLAWLIHSFSTVSISGNTIIKHSIFRTKNIHISDYKTIWITDTLASNIPVAEVIDKDSAKTEKWFNFFTYRQIVLSKEKDLNPYNLKNHKLTVSLTYYEKLYEIIEKEIKTNHNNGSWTAFGRTGCTTFHFCKKDSF